MFKPGRVYKRKSLHQKFGGQQQGGISTPSKHPFIFLFTGISGSNYGYQDKWDDEGVYHYTGEGQIGPMKFSKGNLAIRDHLKKGKDLFLFEQLKKGKVKFISQVFSEGYDIVQGLDKLKNTRNIIIFRLSPKIEDKIARICWNTEGWKFPSGPLGKSLYPESYEAEHGYGHEEWLFDRSRIIDDFHYAFLEPLNVESGKHYGKCYNISLFTINGSWQKLYVGDIRNAICISKDEAEKVYRIYEKNGWIKEMADDIRRVGVDPAVFIENLPKYIFNVKFRFEDVNKLDELEEISKNDTNITTNRFKLLTKKINFLINEENMDGESEGEYRNEAKRKAVFKKEIEYDPYHSKMQNALKRLLQESYKDEYDKVCIEKGRIDIKARTKSKKWHYFEIKTDSPKICIRSALGQIMEYAYWPDLERAEKLIIVGPSPLDNDATRYIRYIRNKFRIPIHYRSLDIDKKILSSDY